ncbi:hypothetical protein BWI17_06960 [Betaproteobacteria bacterium GR16-43]|nr:hypothetical protein BWI17_06960 [Betaproteobacteria bacterium GR16-43]
MHDAGAPSLYRRFLGPSFDLLPRELRAFHDVTGHRRYTGHCTIAGAETALGRLAARILGLPRSGEGAMSFELHAADEGETWSRHFPGKTLSSRLHVEHGVLVERMGVAQMRFEAREANGRELSLALKGVRILGVPMPRFLLPQVRAVETASPDRLHFDIAASWPGVGRIIAYRGSLDVGPGKEIA